MDIPIICLKGCCIFAFTFCRSLLMCESCSLYYNCYLLITRMRNDHKVKRFKKSVLIILGCIVLPLLALIFSLLSIPLDFEPYLYGYCVIGFALSSICFCACGFFNCYVFFLSSTLLTIVITLIVLSRGILNGTNIGVLLMVPGVPIIFEASLCQQIFWLSIYFFLSFSTLISDLAFHTDRKPIDSLYQREILILNSWAFVFLPGAVLLLSSFCSTRLKKREERRVRKICKSIVKLDLEKKRIRRLLKKKKKRLLPVERSLKEIASKLIEYRKYLPESLLLGEGVDIESEKDYDDSELSEGEDNDLSNDMFMLSLFGDFLSKSLENHENEKKGGGQGNKIEKVESLGSLASTDTTPMHSPRSQSGGECSSDTSSSNSNRRRRDSSNSSNNSRNRGLHVRTDSTNSFFSNVSEGSSTTKKNMKKKKPKDYKALRIEMRKKRMERLTMIRKNMIKSKKELGLVRKRVVFAAISFSPYINKALENKSYSSKVISYFFNWFFRVISKHARKYRGIVKGIEKQAIIVSFNAQRKCVDPEVKACRFAVDLLSEKRMIEPQMEDILCQCTRDIAPDWFYKRSRYYFNILVFSETKSLMGHVGSNDVKKWVNFGTLGLHDYLDYVTSKVSDFGGSDSVVINKRCKDELRFYPEFQITHTGWIDLLLSGGVSRNVLPTIMDFSDESAKGGSKIPQFYFLSPKDLYQKSKRSNVRARRGSGQQQDSSFRALGAYGSQEWNYQIGGALDQKEESEINIAFFESLFDGEFEKARDLLEENKDMFGGNKKEDVQGEFLSDSSDDGEDLIVDISAAESKEKDSKYEYLCDLVAKVEISSSFARSNNVVFLNQSMY